MVVTKKNDFVEIEFVGKIKDNNEVFDTNIKSEIESAKLNVEAKPYLISIGHGMAISGLDKDVEGKEIGKEFILELKPEDAFGKRNPSMVKMIPMRLFTEQKILPQRGMQLTLDGMVVKIVSVSSGRVLVDFNNPLAGKEVIYTYTIKRIVEDMNEKVNALQDFFFKKKFDFEIKEQDLLMKVDKGIGKYIEMMKKPFQDILGLKVSVEEVEKDNKKN